VIGYSNWGLLFLRILHDVDEIVTIDNTREVQQAIAFNLNTYAISTFHLEIPNSENHKNDGIYV